MTQIDPPFLIGVDGGGTGCRAAVATPDGRILAEGKGGRANVSTDCATAIDSVLTATRNAIESAGLDVADMPRAVAHLGLAGYTGPEMGPRVQAGLPFAKSGLTEDTTTTIVGAVGEQDCHLIALGTGTIVGRQKAGVQTCIGGWCYQVSDQASGAWLGHGVLEQTLLVVDGITPASPLSQQMLDKFGGGAGIVQFSLKARPGDFATLAPDVVQAAAAGDSIPVMQDDAICWNGQPIAVVLAANASIARSADPAIGARAILKKYCIGCHNAEDAEGVEYPAGQLLDVVFRFYGYGEDREFIAVGLGEGGQAGAGRFGIGFGAEEE